MTRETLLLLRNLLTAQHLSVGADNFAEVAGQAVRALQELDAELALVDDPPSG